MKDDDSVLCWYALLDDKDLFKGLIENDKLTNDDLNYLLNRIDDDDELTAICNNTPLIKYILNEFIFNKEITEKLNSMLGKTDWYKTHNIHNIFDNIKQYKRDEDKIDQELLELIELNSYLYRFDFNKDQKLELYEILKNSEIALNRLREIVENHLENTFNFESLKVYLNKKEKKTLLNI